MSIARTIKAEIFVHWLHYRIFPDEYDIEKTILHGVKLVELGKKLKIEKRNERP